MNFTVYQVKTALLVFLAGYALFGAIIIITSQVIKANINSANGPNMDMDTAVLIVSIDLSRHTAWMLYTSFWSWGIVILIYSFYGGFGVIVGSPIHIKVFAFLLLIIASMKVPVIAYTLHLAEQPYETVVKFPTNSLWNNFVQTPHYKKATVARDYVQEWHYCCGVDSYKDYSKLDMEKVVFPKSCCTNGAECTSSDDVKPSGCAEKVANSYLRFLTAIAILSLLVTLFEGVATLLAFYLPHLIRKRKLLLSGSPRALRNDTIRIG
ncbi:hypothetical protein Trydic_g10467 [Trypoxylus dichotomus]